MPPPPSQNPAGHRASPRGRLTRARDGRVIGGVAAGLGHHLGVDPVLVRIVFVALAFAGGAGLLAYLALWLVTPDEDTGRTPYSGRPMTLQQAVALGLIALGVLLLLRRAGLWFGDQLVWPIVLAAAGSAIVWTRGVDAASPTGSARWSLRLPGGRRWEPAPIGPVSPARLVLGVTLVAGGIAGFLAYHDALLAVRDLGLAILAAVVGLGLLFGPWLWRLGDQLTAERRERIRQEERAELAAHLHDSVLQTLALIQHSADDPRRMTTLARRQERELRAWLYGRAEGGDGQTRLSDAVAATAEEIESLHHLAVEVVTVGDAAVGDHARALVAAIREACANTAKHADVDEVAVYVEVEPTEVVAYVRDRGRGFDPSRVGPDRRGLRDSIVGRVERHRGSAKVWSAPGQGTEIELRIPRDDAPADAGPTRQEVTG